VIRGIFRQYLNCASSDDILSLLNNFTEALKHWKAWDGIAVFENHQLVRDYLLSLWRRGLKVSQSSSFAIPV
jgi:hypothetical protein